MHQLSNYNTVVVADQSHRGSFVDSSGFVVDCADGSNSVVNTRGVVI